MARSKVKITVIDKAPDNAFLMSRNGVTVRIENEGYTINKSHTNYNEIISELSKDSKDVDWEKVKSLCSVRSLILSYIGNNLRCEQGHFIYTGNDGRQLDLNNNALALRILDAYKKGDDVGKMIAFFENLILNPSESAVKELFLFLEANDLPLTDDGCFLAYKKVRDDYKDCYSGTFDNSIGSTVSMKREDVNPNRHDTCSTGLHFCSKDYLKSFYGAHIMVLKINPKDVVSIPSDYNNAKGRCCRYEVIGELESEQKTNLNKYAKAQNEFIQKVKGNNFHNTLVFSSIKKALKGIKKEDRKEGLVVSIVNRDGTKTMGFIGGITNKHFKEVTDAYRDVPTFTAVKKALAEYKDRKVGDVIRVKNSKQNSLYKFVDGTTNKHLVKIS